MTEVRGRKDGIGGEKSAKRVSIYAGEDSPFDWVNRSIIIALKFDDKHLQA